METNDLLQDPVFTTDAGVLSLPELLAALSTRADLEVLALQAHQAHLLHAFLVQLAVFLLDRAEARALWTSASAWEEALREATPDPSAWWIEQVDPARPAFMQPPAPDGFGGYQTDYETPDGLDVLGTAKNHDLKRSRIGAPRVEHWVYALIGVQTSGGFGGSGNYGVSRMNGGYASRPVVGFYTDVRWPSRFREDIVRLLAGLERQSEDLFDREGPALLWVEPWDGQKQLSLQAVHPMYIEVCRRVRCIGGVFLGTTTKGERLNGKTLKGNVGDPWIPIKETGEALNVSENGFHYGMVVDLLGDVRLRMPRGMGLQNVHRVLVMEVLACKQGGTAGFHRREVELPERAVTLFLSESTAPDLNERAEGQVLVAAEVRRRVLLPALLKIFDEDPKQAGAHRAFTEGFGAAVDDVFFPFLWRTLGTERGEARQQWIEVLEGIGRRLLTDAIASAPRRSSRPYKAQAEAWSLFEGSLRKHFGTQESV